MLTLKELAPVRLIKNSFYAQVQEAYARNAGPEELKEVLGRARAKKGMFEGDLDEGELEIGQVSGALHDILPAADIVRDVLNEFHELASTALPSIRDQVPQWSPTATSTPRTTS